MQLRSKVKLITIFLILFSTSALADDSRDVWEGVWDLTSWTVEYDSGWALSSYTMQRSFGRAIVTDTYYVSVMSFINLQGNTTTRYGIGTYTIVGNQITFNDALTGGTSTSTFQINDLYASTTERGYNYDFGNFTETHNFTRVSDGFSQFDINQVVATATRSSCDNRYLRHVYTSPARCSGATGCEQQDLYARADDQGCSGCCGRERPDY